MSTDGVITLGIMSDSECESDLQDGQRLPESDTQYFASCPYSQEPHHFTSDPHVHDFRQVSDLEGGHSRCEDNSQTRRFNIFKVFSSFISYPLPNYYKLVKTLNNLNVMMSFIKKLLVQGSKLSVN